MRATILGIGAAFGCVAGVWLVTGSGLGSAVHGQDRKSGRTKGADKPSPKVLDARAEQAFDQFIRETAELARQYEEAGQYQKSKQLLESILKLRPQLTGAKKKIQELDEAMLSVNELEFDVDVGHGWGPPRARVFAEKPLRVKADGSYRFLVNRTVGPEGFPTKEPEKSDMAAQVPCGALMGLIVGKDKSGKPKAGKPFPLGAGGDVTPKQDGLLFVRMNLPPGHQSNGRISVQLSGAVSAGAGR